jgi:hypothetical protein
MVFGRKAVTRPHVLRIAAGSGMATLTAAIDATTCTDAAAFNAAVPADFREMYPDVIEVRIRVTLALAHRLPSAMAEA